MSASVETAAIPGSLIAGRFSVQRVLGQGGMATVVAADDLRLHRGVAIKFLRREFAADGAVAKRFLLEARALVRLRNEHVVTVMDVGTLSDGVPYMVMELLDGESLRSRINKNQLMPITEVIETV